MINKISQKYFPWMLSGLITLLAFSILYNTNELILIIILLSTAVILFSINIKMRLLFLTLLLPLSHAGIGFNKLSGLGIYDIYSFWFIILFLMRFINVDFFSFKKHIIIQFALLLTLAFIPSFLNSISFFNTAKAYIHLLINIGICYGIYFYLTELRSEIFNRMLLKVFASVVIFVSIIGFYQATTSNNLLGYVYGRTYFTLFGEVNYYATYLLFGIPIIIGILMTENYLIKKILYTFGCIIVCVAIISTVSRSAIFILIIMTIFFISYLIIKGKLNKVLLSTIFLILTSLFGLIFSTDIGEKFIDYFTLARRLETVIQGRDVSVIQRKDIFIVGTRMVTAHPIIGVGFGTFEDNFDKYKETNLSTGFSRSAHNTPLRIFAETGIIGFLAFINFVIGLIIYSLKNIKRITKRENRILAWSVFVSLITFLLMCLTLDILFEPYFWIITGFLIAHIELNQK